MELNPRYLLRDVDRHGNERFYVRRSGRKIRIREPVGTPAFHRAYAVAVERLVNLSLPKVAKGHNRGTLGWLGAQYVASAEFKSMESTSQQKIRQILESCFREPFADGDPEPMANCPIENFTALAVKRLRDLKVGKPGAANSRRRWLSAMFSWAVEQAPPLAKSNPVRDVKRVKYESTGFHTWTSAEIATFEKCHPIGTRARLALALLMFTGIRRSDAVKIGPAHVVDGWLRFVPHKTRKRRPGASEKPWLPVLASIVAATPHGSKTFLVTNKGNAFSADSFGNWFRECCTEAGLPHCTPHGLRKAGAVRAAENGATTNQLMAVFDWLTADMAKRYTDAADRKRLAGQAMSLLCPTDSNPSVPPINLP